MTEALSLSIALPLSDQEYRALWLEYRWEFGHEPTPDELRNWCLSMLDLSKVSLLIVDEASRRRVTKPSKTPFTRELEPVRRNVTQEDIRQAHEAVLSLRATVPSISDFLGTAEKG